MNKLANLGHFGKAIVGRNGKKGRCQKRRISNNNEVIIITCICGLRVPILGLFYAKKGVRQTLHERKDVTKKLDILQRRKPNCQLKSPTLGVNIQVLEKEKNIMQRMKQFCFIKRVDKDRIILKKIWKTDFSSPFSERIEEFCKNIIVVLCKKSLGKTANIREMRRFWKSAILQRLWPMPGL